MGEIQICDFGTTDTRSPSIYRQKLSCLGTLGLRDLSFSDNFEIKIPLGLWDFGTFPILTPLRLKYIGASVFTEEGLANRDDELPGLH